MTTFSYKAKRIDGQTYEGTFEGKSRFELYDHIRREGGTLLSSKESSPVQKVTTFDMKKIDLMLSRISIDEQVLMTRNLSAMLNAGLPLSRALNVVTRQSRNPKMKDVMTKLAADINRGSDLNSALEKFPEVFSELTISMVKAGEESGKLPEALKTISDQLHRASELKKKIRGAMIYPGIIVSVMLGVATLMLIFVVPTLNNTFEELGAELPVLTKFIIALSDMLVSNTITVLVSIITLIAASMALLRTEKGSRAWEAFVLHLPIVGSISKEINSARTARTLSSLLSAGVEVVRAFEITAEVMQNSHYREVVLVAKERVQKGLQISETFEENEKIYPPLVAELIAVGEETGELSSMLKEAADFYESEVELKTKNLSTIIEPFLMVIVGIAVGFFALSMITPIYSITSGVSK